jgi:hypothetical protein
MLIDLIPEQSWLPFFFACSNRAIGCHAPIDLASLFQWARARGHTMAELVVLDPRSPKCGVSYRAQGQTPNVVRRRSSPRAIHLVQRLDSVKKDRADRICSISWFPALIPIREFGGQPAFDL